MQFKDQQASKQQSASKKQEFENRYLGKIPKYLQRFREEEEQERQKTKEEIAMNKRPAGTRVVTKQEQDKVLNELYGQK